MSHTSPQNNEINKSFQHIAVSCIHKLEEGQFITRATRKYWGWKGWGRGGGGKGVQPSALPDLEVPCFGHAGSYLPCIELHLPV